MRPPLGGPPVQAAGLRLRPRAVMVRRARGPDGPMTGRHRSVVDPCSSARADGVRSLRGHSHGGRRAEPDERGHGHGRYPGSSPTTSRLRRKASTAAALPAHFAARDRRAASAPGGCRSGHTPNALLRVADGTAVVSLSRAEATQRPDQVVWACRTTIVLARELFPKLVPLTPKSPQGPSRRALRAMRSVQTRQQAGLSTECRAWKPGSPARQSCRLGSVREGGAGV